MVEKKHEQPFDIANVIQTMQECGRQVCLCPECGKEVELLDPSGITSSECKNPDCKRSYLFCYKIVFMGDSDKPMRPFFSIGIYARTGNERRVS